MLCSPSYESARIERHFSLRIQRFRQLQITAIWLSFLSRDHGLSKPNSCQLEKHSSETKC